MSILPLSGQSLGVFVVQAAGQALQHGQRGEVLAGDHLEATLLPPLLVLHHGHQLGIQVPEVAVQLVSGSGHLHSTDGELKCGWTQVKARLARE